MIAQLFIVILTVYTVQADEISFNQTRTAIFEELLKTVNDFNAFLQGLEAEKVKLNGKLDSTTTLINQLSLTHSGRRMGCLHRLNEKFSQLKLDFQNNLETSPGAINVRQSIDDLWALIIQCLEDLFLLNRYYDCTNEACREEVEIDANNQLVRAVEGVRVKEIMQSISDNYPSIDATVEEYNVKHDGIWEEWKVCLITNNVTTTC